MPYLDTSVLTAYYCREKRSQRVQRILWELDEPAISPLGEVEFHCAVARKVRSRTMKRSAAQRVFSEFRSHLDEPRYTTVSIRTTHYDLASEWLARLVTPLRVLDALHLTVAFTNDLPLLTADRDLARSAEHFGVECELVP